MQSIQNISVKVQRVHEDRSNAVGPVPIYSKHIKNFKTSKVEIEAHLDSVYDWKGKEVYKLKGNKTDYHNKFQLIVDVFYSKNQLNQTLFCSQTTKPFKMIGKNRSKKPDGIKDNEGKKLS